MRAEEEGRSAAEAAGEAEADGAAADPLATAERDCDAAESNLERACSEVAKAQAAFDGAEKEREALHKRKEELRGPNAHPTPGEVSAATKEWKAAKERSNQTKKALDNAKANAHDAEDHEGKVRATTGRARRAANR